MGFKIPYDTGSEPDFVLSKITGPRWLELPIAQTDFDSPFELEPTKFYCIYIIAISVYSVHL
jgi:hypothetical protein